MSSNQNLEKSQTSEKQGKIVAKVSQSVTAVASGTVLGGRTINLSLNPSTYKEASRLASLLGMNHPREVIRMAMMLGLSEIKKRFETELKQNDVALPPNVPMSEPPTKTP